MEITQAIMERKSCRHFTDRPVSKETLEELMKLTCRAPSALNLQPWQFTVVMGEEVLRLGRRLLKAHQELGFGCKPDNVKPLPEIYQKRRKAQSHGNKEAFEEAGIENPAGYINHGSLVFYSAPAVVIATLHKVFPDIRALDVGIAMGWLLLAARELGLDTCPLGLLCMYQDQVRDHLNIDDDREVVMAAAVGYGVQGSPLNRFHTPRADFDELVRWY